MIAKQIVISEIEILNKYSNLNEKVKFIIEKLYEIDKYQEEYKVTNEIKIKTILVDKELLEKSKSFSKDYRDKTGVYIFLNNNNIPVYIGFSGKGKKQDLKKRIENQLSAKDNNCSNLVYNIIKIEEKLDNEGLKNNIPEIESISITLQLKKEHKKKSKNEKSSYKAPEIDFKKLQNIILKYTSSLIVIDCGNMYKDKISMEKNEENVKFVQALELILIALFNSKYNL